MVIDNSASKKILNVWQKPVKAKKQTLKKERKKEKKAAKDFDSNFGKGGGDAGF